MQQICSRLLVVVFFAFLFFATIKPISGQTPEPSDNCSAGAWHDRQTFPIGCSDGSVRVVVLPYTVTMEYQVSTLPILGLTTYFYEEEALVYTFDSEGVAALNIPENRVFLRIHAAGVTSIAVGEAFSGKPVGMITIGGAVYTFDPFVDAELGLADLRRVPYDDGNILEVNATLSGIYAVNDIGEVLIVEPNRDEFVIGHMADFELDGEQIIDFVAEIRGNLYAVLVTDGDTSSILFDSKGDEATYPPIIVEGTFSELRRFVGLAGENVAYVEGTVVKIVSLRTGGILSSFDMEDEVTFISLSFDGESVIASAAEEGRIVIYNSRTGIIWQRTGEE